MRSKHRASLAVLAVAAAAGIGGAVTVAVGGGSPEPSALATRGELLSTGAGLGQGLALDGSRLVASEAGAQRELAELGGGEEVIAALTGALVPVATASADGSLIVYSTWRQLAVLDYEMANEHLPAGTNNPYQLVIAYPGTPASAIVGRSGNAGSRLSLVTPRPRKRPAFRNGAACAGARI